MQSLSFPQNQLTLEVWLANSASKLKTADWSAISKKNGFCLLSSPLWLFWGKERNYLQSIQYQFKKLILSVVCVTLYKGPKLIYNKHTWHKSAWIDVSWVGVPWAFSIAVHIILIPRIGCSIQRNEWYCDYYQLSILKCNWKFFQLDYNRKKLTKIARFNSC